MDNQKLKPCPECGSKDVEMHDDGHYYFGKCRSCGFCASKRHHKWLAEICWNSYPREQEEIA